MQKQGIIDWLKNPHKWINSSPITTSMDTSPTLMVKVSETPSYPRSSIKTETH